MNMKSIFLVWKDKNCNGENPEWIYMKANEFFEFKKLPENADRRFVQVAACLYGEGEPFNATPEEIAYLTRRAEADDNFFYGHCKHAGHSDFTFTWSPEELYGMEME